MANLSINGMAPVRKKPFPSWPIFGSDEERALLEVLHSGSWFLGAKVEAFEQAFATFHDAQFSIATSSGTTALQVALSSAGIQPGDEVIVPAYTFIATASAVVATGAIPIFVDIQPGTYNIDPQAVDAAVTGRTRAVIAVHIGGQPADLDALLTIVRKHSIRLIEDSAQAHAAAWKGRKVGAIGDLGTFSFQASKNLNAGEGGCVTTNDRELAERAWSIHNCGRSRAGAWYEHPLIGSNYRMTEFQAALLLSQLKRIESQTSLRTRNAELLNSLLDQIDGSVPLELDPRVTTHAYHLYIFRYQAEHFSGVSRDCFVQALQREGIPCSSGYRPLYKEPAFCPAYEQVACPETERICAEEAVWLTQNLLLGTAEDTQDIARAIARIQTHSSELKQGL